MGGAIATMTLYSAIRCHDGHAEDAPLAAAGPSMRALHSRLHTSFQRLRQMMGGVAARRAPRARAEREEDAARRISQPAAPPPS